MNLQYISDSDGQTTGVYIPIKEWNKLQKKFKGFEQVEGDIPMWHKEAVSERLGEYKKNPGLALDFNKTMDAIEKEM